MADLPAHKQPLTEIEKSRITHLAFLDFGPKEIAVLLGFNKRYFSVAARDESTEIGLAYLKGRLKSKETIRQTLVDAVEDENVTATQVKIRESKALEFEDIKCKVFGL